MTTQPGAPVTQGELMRLLVQQIPALARRAVPVPSTRLGTVATVDGPTARVTLDGDPSPVTIQVAVPGGVVVEQRVVVEFYPPHGALVTGVLGEVAVPRGHLGRFTGSGSFDATTPTLGSLAPVPLPFAVGRLYRAYLTCVWLSDAADTTVSLALEMQPAAAGTWPTLLLTLRDTAATASVGVSTETCAGHVDFEVAVTGSYDLRVVGSVFTGPGVVTVNTNNLRVSVDDVGAA